ncbi:hypothetical protein [Candidiatus Paracoxiella cheracis]
MLATEKLKQFRTFDASHGEAKPMASIPRQPPIFDRAECRRNGVP